MEDAGEVSEKDVETYTLVSAVLKHPVRRRILRMLSEKPMLFTEIQNTLKIGSAHLSYHLQSMQELLNQTGYGKYSLSTFGDATTALMHGVEETEETRPRKKSKIRALWSALPLVLLSSMLILASSYILYCPISYNVIDERNTSAEGTWKRSFYVKNGSRISWSYEVHNYSAYSLLLFGTSDMNLTFEEAQWWPKNRGIIDIPLWVGYSSNKVTRTFSASSAGEYSLMVLTSERTGPVNFDLKVDITDPSYNEMYRALLLVNLCFLVLYSKHFWSIGDWLTKKRLSPNQRKRRKWLARNWKCLTGDALSITVIVLAFLFSWMAALVAATLILFFRLLAPYSKGTDPVYELHLNRDLDNQKLS